MEQSMIEIDDHDILVWIIDLDIFPLIIFKAHKCYVMSEYLNISIANKLGDIAGVINHTQTINDALNSKIIQVSNKAKRKGLNPGITAAEFLRRLS